MEPRFDPGIISEPSGGQEMLLASVMSGIGSGNKDEVDV
jgi:hypothetical protein